MSADPLTLALKPPAGETPEARQRRILIEKEAKQVSDEIDAQLKLEQKAMAKQKKEEVRLLLLGQSESGKSTTLKNFQMRWAPQSWREEKTSWRTVVGVTLMTSKQLQLVLLNLAKSALHMVSVLLTQPSGESISSEELRVDLVALYDTLAKVEVVLKNRICAGAGSDEFGDYRTGPGSLINQDRELYMPSNTSWKDRFLKAPRRSLAAGRPATSDTMNSRDTFSTLVLQKDDAMEALIVRKRDIQCLWKSSIVQELLRRRGVRLDDNPGFFLEDLDRILHPDYTPSDDDVVRARLRTMGIQEHKFVFESGNEVGREWIIYDVGGSRPQVSAWFSFFEDVHAILFIVPVNCFDEVLEEDNSVNRLQDSIKLWKEICCSPLLAKAQLILFLNKASVDLLKKKLESGVPFAHFVPRYGDRRNDVNSVCRYLRTQFKEIQTHYSPVERTFTAWLTCATVRYNNAHSVSFYL
ncbi:G-alpha-domain-containing protein [Hysterangium stoloniferum]|nr:G-alpha-domain-containing protein [Hysterangium stoloniferum]